MKKNAVKALTIAALLSIAAAGIGTANAYFTDHVEAKGARQISFGDTTTFKEELDGWNKRLTVTNSPESTHAVWVRAFAIVGQQYMDYLSCEGSDWTEGEGDFYYYKKPVEPGGSTTKLVVSIGDHPVAELEKENFNVIVVYETTPAFEKLDEDGNPTGEYEDVDYAAVNWERTAEEG